jgi:hypothetical protein
MVGHMLMLSETSETPTDHEWDAFLKVLVANRAHFATLRILVMTEGGGPTAGQRKRLEMALGGQSVKVAVVTDSIKVRFIVSSVALLNHSISTFSRSEFAKAVAFLGLAPQEHRVAIRLIDEMAKELIE